MATPSIFRGTDLSRTLLRGLIHPTSRTNPVLGTLAIRHIAIPAHNVLAQNLRKPHRHGRVVQHRASLKSPRANQTHLTQFSNHHQGHFNQLTKRPRRYRAMHQSHAINLQPSSNFANVPNTNMCVLKIILPAVREYPSHYGIFQYLSSNDCLSTLSIGFLHVTRRLVRRTFELVQRSQLMLSLKKYTNINNRNILLTVSTTSVLPLHLLP